MSMLRNGWIGLFCLSLCCGFAGQNGPAGQLKPAAAVPPDSANRRMTLDVVVTDKSGKPIAGLEQQDFTLFDNELPQKIVSFRAVESGAAPADPPVQAVLLVDEVNTSFSKVASAREEIKAFLRKLNGPLPFPVSIAYFADSGLAMGDPPTRDANALAASIDQHKAALRAINNAQGFYGALERQQLSIWGLGQLAQNLVTVPGRKLVIWVSPGWPLLTGPRVNLAGKNRQWVFDSIVNLSARLREARISLYQIDPLGLADSSGMQNRYAGYLKGAKSVRQAENANVALQVFAVQSGGLVLNSNNDVAGEIATCIADATAYYVISFDAAAGARPNEYHAIEIKLAKPGLKVRTRSGYYAQPNAPPAH